MPAPEAPANETTPGATNTEGLVNTPATGLTMQSGEGGPASLGLTGRSSA
jgi:hypothetical protein